MGFFPIDFKKIVDSCHKVVYNGDSWNSLLIPCRNNLNIMNPPKRANNHITERMLSHGTKAGRTNEGHRISEEIFLEHGVHVQRTWKYAKSKYFLMILDSVKSTVQPFVLLIIPKYILDELASERRVDVTLRYIAYYAAAVVGFNLISLIISRFGSDQSMKIDHRVAMDQHTKWLHMDYDKFENGRVRDLEARSVSAAGASEFRRG